VDVAKRLTFRIRGGMLMVGSLNTKGECSRRKKKMQLQLGATLQVGRSSTGMPRGAFFQSKLSKIYRCSGAKTVVDFDLPTLLIMATTGLAQYQTCMRTRKCQYKSQAIHYGEKLVVSDSLHSVVFGLTLDRLINLERSSYMTGCPVHQLKK